MLDGKKIDVNSLSSMARSIWLAGLGAYAKTNEKVIDSADKAYETANAKFQEFLAKGEAMQSEATDKTRTELDKISKQFSAKLGLSASDEQQKVEALEQRIDGLTAAVTALVEQKLAQVEAAVAEQEIEVNETAQAQALPEVAAVEIAEAPETTDSTISEQAVVETVEPSVSVEPASETLVAANETVTSDTVTSDTSEKPAPRRTTARRGRRNTKSTNSKA